MATILDQHSIIRRSTAQHIILMGAPSAGKTQFAQFLQKHGQYLHIMLSDILRQEVEQETALGVECKKFLKLGTLIPAKLTSQIFAQHFDKAEENNKRVIIESDIDCEPLSSRVSYVYLRVSRQIAEERLIKRRGDDMIIRRLDRFFKTSIELIERHKICPGFIEIDAEESLSSLQTLYRHVFIQPKVLGIGYAPVDRMIKIQDQDLEEMKISKGGAPVVTWDTFSQVLDREGQMIAGGSAANTIRGLARLGQNTSFLAKIGEDEAGRHFDKALTSYQIDSMLIKSQTPSGQVACLITPDAQRTMLIFLGAGRELTEKDLTLEQFSGIKVLHIDSYTIWNDSLLETALKLAKDAGACVSFDLGAREVASEYKDRILGLLQYVDIVFGNEDEIRALTGMDPKEGIEFLKTLSPVVVAKIGHEGCLVASRDQQTFHSPAFVPEAVIDTTGAGDYFASGFLHGYLEGRTLEECARFGNLLGSAAVEIVGAEIPDSKWDQLNRSRFSF